MANNGRDTKHTSQIARRLNFLGNGENWKMHNVELCEGGLQLADIATKNVGEYDLTPRMKYIMVRLENWDLKTCTRGVTEYRIVYRTRVLYYHNIFSWGLDSIIWKKL